MAYRRPVSAEYYFKRTHFHELSIDNPIISFVFIFWEKLMEGHSSISVPFSISEYQLWYGVISDTGLRAFMSENWFWLKFKSSLFKCYSLESIYMSFRSGSSISTNSGFSKMDENLIFLNSLLFNNTRRRFHYCIHQKIYE